MPAHAGTSPKEINKSSRCMITRVRNWYVRVRENMLISFFCSAWMGEGEQKNNSKFTDPNYPISEYAYTALLSPIREGWVMELCIVWFLSVCRCVNRLLHVNTTLSNYFGFPSNQHCIINNHLSIRDCTRGKLLRQVQV